MVDQPWCIYSLRLTFLFVFAYLLLFANKTSKPLSTNVGSLAAWCLMPDICYKICSLHKYACTSVKYKHVWLFMCLTRIHGTISPTWIKGPLQHMDPFHKISANLLYIHPFRTTLPHPKLNYMGPLYNTNPNNANIFRENLQNYHQHSSIKFDPPPKKWVPFTLQGTKWTNISHHWKGKSSTQKLPFHGICERSQEANDPWILLDSWNSPR